MSEKSNGSSAVHNRQRMIQYLLGELSETARTQFEETFFSDQKTFEQLQIVEDQLIDDYVNDTLSEPVRRKFEASYLNSERRHKKLQFAQDLKATLTPLQNVVIPAEKVSRWQSIRAMLHFPGVQIGFATASLLLIASGIYFFAQPGNLKRQAQLQVQNSVAPVVSEAITPPTKSNDPGEQTPMQSSATTAGVQTKASIQTQKQQSEPLIFLSVLRPGQLRDSESGSAPNKIALTPQIATLSLKLKLSPDQKYSSYHVEVETSSGKKLINRDNLTKSKDGKALVISIPAQSLSTDDYVLILAGKNARQEFVEINDYHFRVVKQ